HVGLGGTLDLVEQRRQMGASRDQAQGHEDKGRQPDPISALVVARQHASRSPSLRAETLSVSINAPAASWFAGREYGDGDGRSHFRIVAGTQHPTYVPVRLDCRQFRIRLHPPACLSIAKASSFAARVSITSRASTSSCRAIP